MCPPGVDQTTRTSQRWRILLPAKEERHDFYPGNECFPPEQYLVDNARFGAFEKLLRLDVTVKEVNSPVASSISATSTKLSFLERLPVEMLSTILSGLQPKDTIALGMCSQVIWAHVLEHIRQDARRRRAPWANTPLMITGTWLTDLPPAVYDIFPDEIEHQKAYEGRSGRWYGPCPARTWNWNVRDDYLDVEGCDASSVWLNEFDPLYGPLSLGLGSGLSVGWRQQLKNDLDATLTPTTHSETGHWLLRNLTANKVVRLEGSSSFPAGTYVEGAPWLSPDIVLVLHILWGTASNYPRDEQREDLFRGEWAGHCFDIVPAGKNLDDDWKDVTEVVVTKGREWGCDARESWDSDNSEPEFRQYSKLRRARRGQP